VDRRVTGETTSIGSESCSAWSYSGVTAFGWMGSSFDGRGANVSFLVTLSSTNSSRHTEHR